jgi:hypothetical protein
VPADETGEQQGPGAAGDAQHERARGGRQERRQLPIEAAASTASAATAISSSNAASHSPHEGIDVR